MDTTEGLLAAWRAAETAVEAATPGTTGWRAARRRADYAKSAYLAHVDDILDVEGHRHDEPPPATVPGRKPTGRKAARPPG